MIFSKWGFVNFQLQMCPGNTLFIIKCLSWSWNIGTSSGIPAIRAFFVQTPTNIVLSATNYVDSSKRKNMTTRGSSIIVKLVMLSRLNPIKRSSCFRQVFHSQVFSWHSSTQMEEESSAALERLYTRWMSPICIPR